jgi:hypothetical protein
MSCRVTLTKTAGNVSVETNGFPDHKSSYFNSSDACYEAISSAATTAGRAVNPNKIASQTIAATIPFAGVPGSSVTATGLGVIGIAVDGTSIYNNAAAPGDSIYNEVKTFDNCEGHPDNQSRYHYHIQPPSISSSDSRFIGVMRDGHPIYGIKDADGSPPSLDKAGGHVGTTPDSTEIVYHYHVNLQTAGSDSAYFISTGYYKGTAGSCTGCL